MMSKSTYKKNRFAMRAATGIVLAISLFASNVMAGEHEIITPDVLAQMLKDKYGKGAIISNGVLFGTDAAGKIPFNFTVPGGTGPQPFAAIGTASTPIWKGYGECSSPTYNQNAGYMYVEWCEDAANIGGVQYEVKSAYYFYNGVGGYNFVGSQYWDCDNALDYAAMPVPVRAMWC